MLLSDLVVHGGVGYFKCLHQGQMIAEDCQRAPRNLVMEVAYGLLHHERFPPLGCPGTLVWLEVLRPVAQGLPDSFGQ